MGILEQFQNYAADFAQQAHQRITDLDREIGDLKVKLVQIEAQRDSARGALKRLADYPVKIGIDYACPRCWINNGRASPMRDIQSETHNDLFRCQTCHLDLEIEH